MARCTVTLTFGEQAENHRGMEKLGAGLAESGFTIEDLKDIQTRFEEHQVKCELVRLDQVFQAGGRIKPSEAAILIARQGVAALLGETGTLQQLENEQFCLQWDTKALMYGRVVNKHARHNLCFASQGQEPDYGNGKGRVIPLASVPLTSAVASNLATFFGPKAENPQVEGNFYYDISKCGIGFHGDAERRRIIGVRLGATMSLHYQWYLGGSSVGPRIPLSLDGGDVYVMSEKAAGTDWRCSSFPTLRHAAGCDKFLRLEKTRSMTGKRKSTEAA